MLIDLRKCIGCNTCAVACKSENDVPLGVWRSWVKKIEKGKHAYCKEFFLPIVCNNCAEPICVTVCPVKASIQRPQSCMCGCLPD
jgi:tetrathionate reductase subunit B